MPGPFHLYLVRHAVAEERGPAWPDDALRPLTDDGAKRWRRQARGPRRHRRAAGPDPDQPVHAGPPDRRPARGRLRRRSRRWWSCRRCSPAPSRGTCCGRSSRTRRRASLALVGHEPGLGELAALAGRLQDAAGVQEGRRRPDRRRHPAAAGRLRRAALVADAEGPADAARSWRARAGPRGDGVRPIRPWRPPSPVPADPRAGRHHAALRHDDDPLADHVARAFAVDDAGAVDQDRAVADARVLVDDDVLEHAVVADAERRHGRRATGGRRTRRRRAAPQRFTVGAGRHLHAQADDRVATLAWQTEAPSETTVRHQRAAVDPRRRQEARPREHRPRRVVEAELGARLGQRDVGVEERARSVPTSAQ